MERKVTDIMQAEHRVIQRTVDVMAALAATLGAGRPVEVGMLRDVVHVLRAYADRYHHGKEETYLHRQFERLVTGLEERLQASRRAVGSRGSVLTGAARLAEPAARPVRLEGSKGIRGGCVP